MTCWILCTPRTGSSYLCELLNNSGLFKEYNHPFLSGKKGPIQKGLAFNEWLRLFGNRTEFERFVPPYCKTIYHQYVEVMAAIPNNNRYRPGFYLDFYELERYDWVVRKYDQSYVKSLLPDIKFIHLYRSDKVAHAISIYIARQTKKYHIYDETSLSNYTQSNVEADAALLMQCWKDAYSYRVVWDDFLGDVGFLNVSYEDLIQATDNVLANVSDFLGVKIDPTDTIYKANFSNKRIFKMTHPVAKTLEKDLRNLLIKMI